MKKKSVIFSGSGWRDFVTFHGLLPTDKLLLSLTNDSVFEVYWKEGESLRKQSSQKMKYESENLSFGYNSLSILKFLQFVMLKPIENKWTFNKSQELQYH